MLIIFSQNFKMNLKPVQLQNYHNHVDIMEIHRRDDELCMISAGNDRLVNVWNLTRNRNIGIFIHSDSYTTLALTSYPSKQG